MKINRSQIELFLIDESLGSPIHKEERGELLINSPFTSDNKRKCGINYKKGVWNCFKTGKGGPLISFVKEVKGFSSTSEATLYFLKKYFDKESLDCVTTSYRQDEEKEEVKNEVTLPSDATVLSTQEEYISYLRNRHFNENIIDSTKIFVSKSENRVIFPIYEGGRLVFFAKRSIDSNNPIRWLNSSSQGVDPVWNLENIRDAVYIFEGIFDAVRMWPYGVAIFGNIARKKQIEKILAKNPRKIVVVLDGDRAGFSGQRRTADRFADLHNNVWIHLWDFNGPKDFGGMNEIKLNEVKWDNSGKLLWNLKAKENFPELIDK